MKGKLELATYLLFGLAAFPLAWAAFDLLIHYADSPESLQGRETHRDAMILFTVLPFTLATLIPATLSASYLLVRGQNRTRAAILVLIGLYVAFFCLPFPALPINTLGNLLWDAAITSLLVIVPSLFLIVRYKRMNMRAPGMDKEKV